MSCNTITCENYRANVLGNGTQQHGIDQFWVKDKDGNSINWANFSENSENFTGNPGYWIGIGYTSGMSEETEVARLRVQNCEGGIIEIISLKIPTGATWAKWLFTSSFGSGCHYRLQLYSWGTGPLTTPPPPGPKLPPR